MRKIRASFFTSLDGVVESPQDWHFPFQNDEMTAAVGAGMESADAVLLGRNTYLEWASYWPHQPSGAPMADYFNRIAKYVVSSSLRQVEWQNTTVLSGPLVASVEALKREPGGDILMSGSGTLVTSLLEAGLVDELRLMIHPVVLGRGGRLFDGGEQPRRMALVDSTTFSTGVLCLTYAPDGAGGAER